jgi:hypothetical protein
MDFAIALVTSRNTAGLNAAGRMLTAISYYLPLERVVRALTFVKQGLTVPRGTLQTVFVHQPFHELVRLGLPRDEEQKFRDYNESVTGGLVVHGALPSVSATAP